MRPSTTTLKAPDGLAASVVGARVLRFPGCRIPFVPPDYRDPRLHVAAIIVSLQVLGQTVLHFDVSVAQILVAVGVCAALEIAITVRRQGVLVWPASALLTGNGVAFVLRVPGTQHGDWWSLRGVWIFATVAAVSLLSKYVIRVDDRPLFNPSNFGLVLCFLILGSRRTDPLDFWWVHPGYRLAFALALIVLGGVALAKRVNMFHVVVAFWVVFSACLAVIAWSGHTMTARWSLDPVSGSRYWSILVTSPEVLVFLFFMITDPKTAPRDRVARTVYGASIALTSAVLMALQRTEFATKVALLAALALVCAARPALERALPAGGSDGDHLRQWLGGLALRGHGRAAPTVRALIRSAALASVVAAIGGLLFVLGASPHSTASASPGVSQSIAPSTCHGEARADRPDTSRVARPIPTVNVGQSLNVESTLSEARAQHIAANVAADLAIAATAIRERNPALAATAIRGPLLDDLLTSMCRTTGTVDIPSYDLDSATVTLVKRVKGQARPEIDVRLVGREHLVRFTQSNPKLPLVERTIRYDTTLVVSESNGYFLICGEKSDTRTANCSS